MVSDLEIWLVDVLPDLVNAWKREFKEFPEVHAACGNILELAEDTIVSPAKPGLPYHVSL